MSFVKDTFSGSGFGAATPGTATSLFDPGDILGTHALGQSQEAAAAAEAAQLQSIREAREETRRSVAAGQEFLSPYGGIGLEGVEKAGFLTDPQAQFDFLQSNPLFQMALDEANVGTQNMAAASGRLSAGDTLQQLSKNVLLSASPLIAEQKSSIGDLLNLGTGVSRAQANLAIGEGSDISSLIQSRGNVLSSGLLGQNQLLTQATQGRNQLAGSVAGAVMSDPRLKRDRKVKGSKNGLTLWSWTWNKLANDLFGLHGKAQGVMADEVKDKRPEAIIYKDGFMMVNYDLIGI